MHRILLKQTRLQQATEAGDAELWITQVVAHHGIRNSSDECYLLDHFACRNATPLVY